MLQIVHHCSKAKKLHIYSRHGWCDVGKVTERSLCTEKTEALIQCEGKDEMGKNADMLKLTRNSRLCFSHFKLKISPDRYTSGDPVYFA